MAELAAHLVDGVLGGLPVRQWVLTLPYRLRYALAWDHRLCRAVLAVFIRAVLSFERRRTERRGIPGGAGGAVTAIQRFGSALNMNVHFHTLVAQGVFIEDADGKRRFVPSPAPTDVEVSRLLVAVRRRIVRLVARHGIDLEDPSGEAPATDDRQFDWPMYGEIQGAAVVGRVATGPRAGGLVQRVGRDRYVGEIRSTGPLQAHLDGFGLHAAVAVPAGDRARLEHLCRYVLRPPIAATARRAQAISSTTLRTAHTIAFAALYGGHVYGVSAPRLVPALVATVASGAALMATEMYRTPLWPVQVRGVVAFVKLALVAAVAVWWDGRLLFLTLALVIGGVVSHMPGRYRYYSLLHGRVVGEQESG